MSQDPKHLATVPKFLTPHLSAIGEQAARDKIYDALQQIIQLGVIPELNGAWPGKIAVIQHLKQKYSDVMDNEAEEIVDAAAESIIDPINHKSTERRIMVYRLSFLRDQLLRRINEPISMVTYEYREEELSDEQLARGVKPKLLKIPTKERVIQGTNDKIVRQIVEIEAQIALINQLSTDIGSSDNTSKLFAMMDENSENSTTVSLSVVQKHGKKSINELGKQAADMIKKAASEMKIKQIQSKPVENNE